MPGTFNSMITRADADALIPEEVAAEVIAALPEESAAMRLFRRVNMGTKIARMPVLSSLGQAYWVNGDTGLKQTTDYAWTGVDLVAEELAAIVPVPDAVVDDAAIPIWDEVRPLIAAEVGRTVDQAVFAGTNKPTTWPGAIIAAAVAAANRKVVGATSAQGGIAQISPTR
jgi:HK97 family phage major capsid protein